MIKKIIVVILMLTFINNYSQDEIKNYEIKNISVNNKYSSLGTNFYGSNKIVFSSNLGGKMYNFYVGEIINDDIKTHRLFYKGEKSYTHQMNPVFTNDLKTVYFTRSMHGLIHRKKSKRKKATIAMFKATINSAGVFTNVIPMPFNNDKYDVGHPTLNRENTKLYFSSTMPGTLGKSDIFEVDILPNGEYSEPSNLGPNVNTKGNELHPFISGDNYLYFSSNGHKNNFGEMDIYSVQVNENGITKPIHLDEPINSSADDFSYIFNSITRQGFFTSNRKGGKGSDDIYFFKEKTEVKEKTEKKIECTQKVRGSVFAIGTYTKIPNVTVLLVNSVGEEINSFKTTKDGSYFFDLDCNETYYVEASKEGYNTITKKVKTIHINKTHKKDLFLVKIKTIKTKESKLKAGEIGFNYNESKLYKRHTFQLDKAIIKLIENPNLKIEIESHTDSRAEDDYNMQLTEARIFTINEYLIRKGISIKRIRSSAFGETKPLNRCKNGVKCSEEEYLMNRRTVFKLIERK